MFRLCLTGILVVALDYRGDDIRRHLHTAEEEGERGDVRRGGRDLKYLEMSAGK